MTHARNGFLVLSVVAGLAAVVLAGPATQPTTRPYPLKTCVVSGGKLGGAMGEAVIYQHEGREVRFCCKSCIKDFKKDPAKYLKKLDDAEAAAPSTQPSGE